VVIVPVPRRLLFFRPRDDFGAAIHVLARAQPELLIAALEREVADLPDGIPAADRFTREDDLKQHILDMARREEALIVAAANDSVTLDCRLQANPLTILSVAFVTASKAGSAAQVSPDHRGSGIRETAREDRALPFIGGKTANPAPCSQVPPARWPGSRRSRLLVGLCSSNSAHLSVLGYLYLLFNPRVIGHNVAAVERPHRGADNSRGKPQVLLLLRPVGAEHAASARKQPTCYG
jgi:hypothetical protein